MAYGLVGGFLTDKVEEKFDMVPTEEDKKKLRGLVPRITVVEKDEEVNGTRTERFGKD